MSPDRITLQSARLEALVSAFITITCYGLSTSLAAKGLYKQQKPAYIFYIALMIVAAIAIVECLVRWAIVGFGEPNPRRVAQAMGEMLFVYLPAIAACIPLMTAFISFLKSGKAHLTTTPP